MTDRKLMQQALEALEYLDALQPDPDYYPEDYMQARAAIAALRERLAQPEQEPVAWGVFDGSNLHDVNFTEEEAQKMMRLKGDGSVVKPLYTDTQPQMQPCAGRNCGSTNPNLHSAECFEDYEKATGMRAWQGLTEEEIGVAFRKAFPVGGVVFTTEAVNFYRAIEAKLREKNA